MYMNYMYVCMNIYLICICKHNHRHIFKVESIYKNTFTENDNKK